MTVTATHPEYDKFKPIWQLTRDAVEGNPAIKKGGVKYLPADFAKKDTDRYAVYKERAYFMGVTGQTQDATLGMVFRKPSLVELPPVLEAMAENIDGTGQSLEQVAKQAVKEVEETGRYGFLADYPTAEEGLSKAQEQAMGLRPYMATYTAESIINWKTETIGGKLMLALVVLVEEVDKADDEFSHEYEKQYRVLRLRDGVYTQQLYDDAGDTITEEYAPRAGGSTLDHIPFYIAGALNNLPSCDMPLLYDIAIVNIAHYQTTADHRENLFVHGQLTMGITTELSSDEFEKANPNGVVVGAREGLFLGEKGGLHSLTAPESSSLRTGLDDLKEEMQQLGARMSQSKGQNETAEAARINAAAQTATLSTVVANVSDAMTECLKTMALFTGSSDEVLFELNQDFWQTSLDPQLIAAVNNLNLSGTIAKTDVRHMLRAGKIELQSERTDEDIENDVANELLDQ